ncbi:MAG: T9SS type A sorting domain-containing protein [Bacteroidales bacterium]|nr:T9SS type A sorting domain-containing protein [Bacteroidales bacterium]MCF8403383.1 T9SS type A sorting domain-containing protein [Bacteroidales bacterium]
MKTREFLCLALIHYFGVLLSPAICQIPDSLWYKSYGNTMDEVGFDCIEAAEGEYLVIGKTEISNTNWDAYIAKLDNNGNLIWEKSYGGAQDEQIVSICPGLYFGYVMTGYTSTDANGLSDIWILYIDDNGDSIASMKYGSWSSDQGYCIRPNVDQGFIVSSRSSVYQMGDQVHLMKLDISLDTIWTKLYGGTHQDYGHWVEETSDYGYIIAGNTYSSPYPESGDAWVIKTDNNGDTLWTKKFGGEDEDVFYCLTETDDGYIFAGQTWSFGAGLIDVFIVRTDDYGNVIWSETFGGAGVDYAFRLFETEDGNYLASGYSDSYSGSRDVYLVKFDGDGNFIWEEFYGDISDEELMYGGVPTSDGGYLFTGKLDYYLYNQDDLFALKLGPGSTGIDFNTNLNSNRFYNYPNPFNQLTNFHLDFNIDDDIKLTIYNTSGQIVDKIDTELYKNEPATLEWNAAHLRPGIYFAKLQNGESTFIQKIIHYQ